MFETSTRSEAPCHITEAASELPLVTGAARTPDEAVDPTLRVSFFTHAGANGHRGADLTRHALRMEFTWADQRNIFRDSVSFYHLCVLSKSGYKVPCPLPATDRAF